MEPVTKNQRLLSLDALRGFDMFWIIGADEVMHTIAKATGNATWQGISTQFEHPYWEGFTLYDLIFPLFIFVTGISATYSLGGALEKEVQRSVLVRKVITRGLILVLLGIIYNNGLTIKPLEEIRLMSVLGRIGLAYLFSSLIFLYTGPKTQMISFWGILVAYWLIMRFSSAPGFPAGDLTEEGNFSSWFDRTVLPGKLSRGIHDTVGLFNNLPAISSGLAGIITGNLLRKGYLPDTFKVRTMVIAGFACLLLAKFWHLVFPINKNLWSSSFVLQTVAFSLWLMAAFYYVIDVRKWTRATFFRVIGMNSILIYMSGKFIQWSYTNKGFFQWLGDLAGEPWNAVLLAMTMILVKWVFLNFLYKRKMFLKI
jgi:predicted acyltransferase